ncbi:unnamed protein product [Vitrella brassicaformis CCMP3155]|uniref:Sulfatase N-terminal domain-containing protein n=1 Tax=Vitrella brassicaformis (strain CCMP3155) TaxID=1169540 RepID=A0A0G4EQL7_VITBC|nr:unnamed protein product [Vitrella brassicaformis CCMP3155]|eukprot:CEL99729.1 unnamed protein product [Vitrella brassicaformis CCMP3155]
MRARCLRVLWTSASLLAASAALLRTDEDTLKQRTHHHHTGTGRVQGLSPLDEAILAEYGAYLEDWEDEFRKEKSPIADEEIEEGEYPLSYDIGGVTKGGAVLPLLGEREGDLDEDQDDDEGEDADEDAESELDEEDLIESEADDETDTGTDTDTVTTEEDMYDDLDTTIDGQSDAVNGTWVVAEGIEDDPWEDPNFWVNKTEEEKEQILLQQADTDELMLTDEEREELDEEIAANREAREKEEKTGKTKKKRGSTSAKPNFIIMFSDDQRWDAIGLIQQRLSGEDRLYPFFMNETPHMDRMIKEGVFFENAFVTAPLCSPSKGALMSGEYEHFHGVLYNTLNYAVPGEGDNVTRNNDNTIGDILSQHGYNTAYMGKWHMGSQPERPGFNFSASFLHQGSYYDEYQFYINEEERPDDQRKGWVDDLSTSFALRYLEKYRHEPFFLVIGLKAPHEPRSPNGKTLGMYKHTEFPPMPNEHTTPEWYIEGKLPHREKEIYFETLKTIDDNIGRVLNKLDDLDLADNTVVMHFSDNGYFLGSHGLKDKRLPYEESIRIPLIVRYPDMIEPTPDTGRFEKDLVLHFDITATVLDLAGIERPPYYQGKSLRPLFEKSPEDPPLLDDWRDGVLTNYHRDPVWHFWPTWFSWRTQTHKINEYPRDKHWTEVFDLTKDKYEMNNLAKEDSDESRELVEQMRATLNTKLYEAGVPHRMPWFRGTPIKRPYPFEVSLWVFDNESSRDLRKTNDGRLQGGAAITTDRRGPNDGHLVLEQGGGGYMDVSHESFGKAVVDRTVSLWFKADDPLMKDPQTLYAEGDEETGVSLSIKGGLLEGYIASEGRNATILVHMASAEWTHAAVRFLGGDRTFCLFVNGKLIATEETEFDAIAAKSDNAAFGAYLPASPSADGHDHEPSSFFSGLVDDVRVYAFHETIHDDVLASQGRLLAEWTFDDTFNDTNAETNGTLKREGEKEEADEETDDAQETALSEDAPQGAKAVVLDGESTWMDISGDLITRRFSALSLAFWMKPGGEDGFIARVAKWNESMVIFDQGGESAGVSVRLVPINNTLDAAISSSDDDRHLLSVPFTISLYPYEHTPGWTHVTVTFDGTNNGLFAIYINGTQAASVETGLDMVPHSDENNSAIGRAHGTTAFGPLYEPYEVRMARQELERLAELAEDEDENGDEGENEDEERRELAHIAIVPEEGEHDRGPSHPSGGKHTNEAATSDNDTIAVNSTLVTVEGEEAEDPLPPWGFYEGLLDDVALWDMALPESAVADLYANSLIQKA